MCGPLFQALISGKQFSPNFHKIKRRTLNTPPRNLVEPLIVTCHVSRVADLVAGAGDGRRGRGGGVAVGGEHVAGGGAVDNLCNRIVSKGREDKY